MRWLMLIMMITIGLIIFSACDKQSTKENDTDQRQSAERNDAYIFPIRPGTDQWKKIVSSDEQLEACQIPESILKDISTKGLVETVINYPLLMHYKVYSTPEGGIEAVITQFNGFSELQGRDDSSIALLNLYKEINPSRSEELTSAEKCYEAYQIEFIETLLSRDIIISRFSENEMYELIYETKSRYEGKQKSEKLSVDKYTLWLMGRALEKSNFEPFVSEINKNNILKSFLEDGFYLDNNGTKIIIKYADKFLLEYKK